MAPGKGLGKGLGKGGRGKSKAHLTSGGKSTVKKVPQQTLSRRSGLQFPVRRVINQLKKGKYSSRVTATGGIYLTAVLEYLVCEILEVAGLQAAKWKRSRIQPRYIMLAIRDDDELNDLLRNVHFAWGGAKPTTEHKICFLPERFRRLKDPWTPWLAEQEAAKAKTDGKKKADKNKAVKTVKTDQGGKSAEKKKKVKSDTSSVHKHKRNNSDDDANASGNDSD